jgi:hypothetical protein
MTRANDIQHGGTHYKKLDYEHWDWVCDIGLPYLLGCATKYTARWRDKGGALDLDKAVHYLQKAAEREVQSRPSWRGRETTAFLRQLGTDEQVAVKLALLGDYEASIAAVRRILSDTARERALESKESQGDPRA